MFDPLPEREPHAGCSNFRLNVTSRKRPNLVRAVQIIMTDNNKMVAYKVEREPDREYRKVSPERLILFWHDGNKDAIRLPYVLNTAEKAADFIWNWLDGADRGTEPDLDGDCSRDGWSLSNHYMINEYGWDHSAALVVTAVWAEHHK